MTREMVIIKLKAIQDRLKKLGEVDNLEVAVNVDKNAVDKVLELR